jgi:cell filamentation protein
MRDKYGTRSDPACYPGTDVLINKLELRDADLLAEAEAAFAATAAESIEISGPPYDLTYLCRLHRQLFEDVYDWAGEIREVDVSKGQTRFCAATRIAPEADRIFAALTRDGSLVGLDRQDLVRRSAALYDDLNVVHPFREGNGRTLRLFFEHLVLSCGFSISWLGIEADEWISACIAAYSGDGFQLEAIFDRCIGTRID